MDLLASGFVLLLWQPALLFNWGFQLSYLATLGILYLQPVLQRLITPQYYWLEKIWTATTLSIAAQLTTLPLILYYFKQFPLHFIITNWVVVPATFAILTISLALLVGGHLPIIGTLLGYIVKNLIFATNAFICWVAKWPMTTLSSCWVNGRYACLLYIVLLATSLFVQYRNLVYPIIVSICALFYSANRIHLIAAKQKQCKMICCNNNQLSFTLKDGITTWDSPIYGAQCLVEASSTRGNHYAGGIIAIYYNKVILTIHTIPSDWYRWHGAKLHTDYLLIDEALLPDITTIFKVCTVDNLVIYTQADRYSLQPKQLDIRTI